ncbi:tRNA pseudouridine(38-40) synthase TruA [[Clostridium] innocuum]|nr:tRNA pseudouridine(38-40) synthase TruA [[Clostridium] innocuum]
MPRYKVILSYDGSAYGGWQRQTNTHSIQQEVEAAIEKVEGRFVSITASGRTDAHVHALGQVFHFDSVKHLEPENWKRALNSLLPHDIRIQEVCLVDDAFHARFHAISKRYDYLITTEVQNPFYYNYMGKDRTRLDVERMRKCACIFLGTHDFTSFTSSKVDPRKSKIKTITRLDVVQEEHVVRMIFEGNGFLRYMVRMIAQTLIEAGKHRLSVAAVKEMLYGKDKHLCRYKAQAEGLYLVEVRYPKDEQTIES